MAAKEDSLTKNVVERLRALDREMSTWTEYHHGDCDDFGTRVIAEAADEIERLSEKYQNVCRILNEETQYIERLRAALEQIRDNNGLRSYYREIAREALGTAPEPRGEL